MDRLIIRSISKNGSIKFYDNYENLLSLVFITIGTVPVKGSGGIPVNSNPEVSIHTID